MEMPQIDYREEVKRVGFLYKLFAVMSCWLGKLSTNLLI